MLYCSKKRKAIERYPLSINGFCSLLFRENGVAKNGYEPNVIRKKTGIGYSPLMMSCKLRTALYRFLTLQI